MSWGANNTRYLNWLICQNVCFSCLGYRGNLHQVLLGVKRFQIALLTHFQAFWASRRLSLTKNSLLGLNGGPKMACKDRFESTTSPNNLPGWAPVVSCLLSHFHCHFGIPRWPPQLPKELGENRLFLTPWGCPNCIKRDKRAKKKLGQPGKSVGQCFRFICAPTDHYMASRGALKGRLMAKQAIEGPR